MRRCQEDEDEPEGARFPSLAHLDFTGHHCCGAGLVALCKALEKLPNARTLRLGKAMVRRLTKTDPWCRSDARRWW